MLREAWWALKEFTVEAGQSAHAALKPWYIPLQQRLNGRCFRADIHARVGLFAQMSWLVYILAHCRKHELEPVLRFTSPYYTEPDAQPCWLAHLFVPNPERLPLIDASFGQRAYLARVTNFAQLGLGGAYARAMTLDLAQALFNDYFLPAPKIAAATTALLSQGDREGSLLGVHYRGTDKATEAPLVNMGHMLATIAAYLEQNPGFTRIFIASDCADFLEMADRRLKGITLISNNTALRSTDGGAVHSRLSSGANLRKAEEALLDCLALSRCHALIRTASMLSGWSSVFNPKLPVVMLNQPYPNKRWFPDREVLRAAHCSLLM